MSGDGCEACATGMEYATEDQLRGVIERHHTLLRAEKERAEKAEAELAHHRDPIVDKLIAERDRLAATEATTARALRTALDERDAARREILENRLIIVGYEHMSENPSPEEAAECECWFCRSRALERKEGP